MHSIILICAVLTMEMLHKVKMRHSNGVVKPLSREMLMRSLNLVNVIESALALQKMNLKQ